MRAVLVACASAFPRVAAPFTFTLFLVQLIRNSSSHSILDPCARPLRAVLTLRHEDPRVIMSTTSPFRSGLLNSSSSSLSLLSPYQLRVRQDQGLILVFLA
ncbi:MAG: hypothetical protein J3Q66DRAFT_373747 [Benniella sp.]|nr:MAG: hypothetical protein J3Q66DRAFT_373747 [Benniella sp.]